MHKSWAHTFLGKFNIPISLSDIVLIRSEYPAERLTGAGPKASSNYTYDQAKFHGERVHQRFGHVVDISLKTFCSQHNKDKLK